jgi:hypothetical protein
MEALKASLARKGAKSAGGSRQAPRRAAKKAVR